MNPTAAFRSAVAASTAAALVLLPGCDAARPPKSATTDAVSSHDGEALARVYCAACHLFPEPAVLDKASWTNGVLPEMGRLLGVVPLTGASVEHVPNPADGSPQLVEGSDVFAKVPLVNATDWQAIIRFYAANAPATLGQPAAERPAIAKSTARFRSKRIVYRRQVPMTCLIEVLPISAGAQQGQGGRLLVGDGMTRSLELLDFFGSRLWGVTFDSGPISVVRQPPTGASSDNLSYALDVLLVGRLFPSDLQRGSVVRVLPAAATGPADPQLKMETVLRNLRRPVHMASADFNGDAREDFVVCEFGNRSGRLALFLSASAPLASASTNDFSEVLLLDRPGATRCEVRDIDGDGRLDIVALMGQGREGVYLFRNDGNGRFSQRALVEQHPGWGYSYFEFVDFDKDGDLDLLTTNGDNGDSYAGSFSGSPFAPAFEPPAEQTQFAPHKPYHGVRLYLNDGKNHFAERWFFPLHGAYGARVADFDLDGDLDVVAISYFADYVNRPEESFVFFENDGQMNFRASTVPEHLDGRWITLDAGDLDGDGDADVVLGSLVRGPTSSFIPPKLLERWNDSRGRAPAVLVLENLTR